MLLIIDIAKFFDVNHPSKEFSAGNSLKLVMSQRNKKREAEMNLQPAL